MFSGFFIRLLMTADYLRLIDCVRVIEKDGHGEKVLIAPHGNFIKIFRTKKLLSTAAVRPYALRFQNNAEKLACLGIPAVQVHSVFYCPENRRYLVEYRPLAGETLRAVLREGKDVDLLLTRFARFLAELIRGGVCFRSIHFGNVFIQPDSDEPGPIDVDDMRIRFRPLGPMARARNVRHFLRYPEEVRALETFGLERLLTIEHLSGDRRPSRVAAHAFSASC